MFDALLDALGLTPTTAFLFGLPLAVVIAHVVPWLVDPLGIRSVPGPFLAKFSDLWLGWVSAQGHRSEVVHAMHQRYGESLSRIILRRTTILN
jgi:benzoate 4-monooxygenase